MTTFQAIIIAIVEGITEFLPISSTAHMKITNPIIGVQHNAFTNMFEVVIQLGAILSVVTVYHKKFIQFKNIHFYLKLGVAVIPSLVVGALLKKHIDAALGNLWFIAIVMIAGGVVLLFIDKWFTHNTISQEAQISYPKAFMVGSFQVLSIVFPGLSRSASTIIGGMSQKLSRNLAAEFSFFLAVPTMLAASVKSLYDAYKESPEVLDASNVKILGIGTVVSYLVALLAIKFFISYLQKNGFKLFGWYRIIVGLIVLVLLWNKII